MQLKSMLIMVLQLTAGMTKLLVARGDIMYNTFEIVNLDESNPFLVCDNFSGLPYSNTDAAFLYNGMVPIGCVNNTLCYLYEDGVWLYGPECPSLTAFSIVTERKNNKDHDIVIMAGGSLKVQLFDGIRWSTGVYADLPETVWDHCMVRINDSMLMIIGGYTFLFGLDYKVANSYFFNLIENKWIIGPKLIRPRRRPVCGVMLWENNKVVVVAGGYSFYQIPLTTVEFLFLNDYENYNISWVKGVSLPHIIEEPAMVEYQDGVMLVGGKETQTDTGRNLYMLSSPNGTWTRMNQTLKEKRVYHTSAFLVPEEIVNCHL